MYIPIPHLNRLGLSQNQFSELKRSIEKSEYEKAREPLEEDIADLRKQLYDKEIMLQSLYHVCVEFFKNNIRNNKIIISKNKPHLFYGNINEKQEELEYEAIEINDSKILQEFHEKLFEVYKHLNGEQAYERIKN